MVRPPVVEGGRIPVQPGHQLGVGCGVETVRCLGQADRIEDPLFEQRTEVLTGDVLDGEAQQQRVEFGVQGTGAGLELQGTVSHDLEHVVVGEAACGICGDEVFQLGPQCWISSSQSS